MKYRFICAIFHFCLDKDNVSITLPSGFISNKQDLLNATFSNNLSLNTIGLHSLDELSDAP